MGILNSVARCTKAVSEDYFRHFLLYLTILLCFGCSNGDRSHSEVITPEVKTVISVDDVSGKLKISFEVVEGWHIYGPNPQKNGRPTSVKFFKGDKLIEGLQWPQTRTFDEGESGPSEGFDGKFEVVASLSETQREVKPLKAKVTWVACKDICVPGEAELSVDD